MYESPIEICYQPARYSVSKHLDDIVYEAVKNVGISVDKEALVEALRFSKEQYHKGFFEGGKAFAERLKECLKNESTLFTQDRFIVERVMEQIIEEMDGSDINVSSNGGDA